MSKDLTNSLVDRQNILNNQFALDKLKETVNIKGIIFEEKLYFTKNMIAEYFKVDIRTIERYITDFKSELETNGYQILKGKKLKEFKDSYFNNFGTDINVGTKITILGIFDFKAFLNIGMLLVESENAKILRQTMLDIIIDLINQKTGGSTKYINQRDRDFLSSYLDEENYRRKFTDILKNCVNMDNIKYGYYTNKIYISIFKEKANEYREVLRLKEKEPIRDTFYSEILDLVHSYENGLAEMIEKEYQKLGRQLYQNEVDKIFDDLEKLPIWKPLIVKARNKMASRDLALRDAFHEQLKDYIIPLTKKDYDYFLGKDSQTIYDLMQQNQDVLKRLKERE